MFCNVFPIPLCNVPIGPKARSCEPPYVGAENRAPIPLQLQCLLLTADHLSSSNIHFKDTLSIPQECLKGDFEITSCL